jgi:hypothetical protein
MKDLLIDHWRVAAARHPFRLWVAGAMAVGVVMRILVVRATWDYVPHFLLDTATYTAHALWLWQHHGQLAPNIVVHDGHVYQFADANWPPVYPVFLALLVALHQLLHALGMLGSLPAHVKTLGPLRGPRALPTYQYLRTACSVVSTLMVPLVAELARRLVNARVAVVAALLTAVYAPLIYVGASLYSELLATPLILVALLCITQYQKGQKARWLICGGVVGGLTMLTHSDGVALMVPLVVGAWLAARPRARGSHGSHARSRALAGAPGRHRARARVWREGLRALWAPVIVVVAAALTITPWTIRNAVRLHGFVPTGTSLGFTLAGTYNDVAAHSTTRPAAWVVTWAAYPQFFKHVGESGEWRSDVSQDAGLEHLALRYVKQHPAYLLRVAYWNTVRLLDLNGADGADGAYYTYQLNGVTPLLTWVGVISFWIAGLLALAGCCARSVRRGRYRWVWLTPLVMYLAVVLVTTETPRFRAPIDPFVLILAAAALQGGWERLRRRRGGLRDEAQQHQRESEQRPLVAA